MPSSSFVFTPPRHWGTWVLVFSVVGLCSYRNFSWTNNFLKVEGPGWYDQQAQQEITSKKRRRKRNIPLEELVSYSALKSDKACPKGWVWIPSTIAATTATATTTTTSTMTTQQQQQQQQQQEEGNKIPKIIHMTTPSSCVRPEMAQALRSWSQALFDYNIYIHTNEAILHLFSLPWPEFPQFQFFLDCATGLRELTDLWKPLIVWEYGGMFVDMNTLPVHGLNTTLAQQHQQALFEVDPDHDDVLSRHFFAAQPKHPLFFLWVQKVWVGLYFHYDIGKQRTHLQTGALAIQSALQHFMRTQTALQKTRQGKLDPWSVYAKVRSGQLVGLDQHSVTVVPVKSAVVRLDTKKEKKQTSQQMNVQDDNDGGHEDESDQDYLETNPDPSLFLTDLSCQNHLYSQLIMKKGLDKNNDYIPLEDLVDTQPETSCPGELVLIQDVRELDANNNNNTTRKIPRIIHMTSRSRCVTPIMAEAIESWKAHLPDHKFYFHNDAALLRLINKRWNEFPRLQHFIDCSNAFVELADLWRALVLWEYGGIYTDFDNMPKSFHIRPTTESFFEVEQGGWLSQYFFAAEPRHPLIFLLVHQTWTRIYELGDIGNQYPPFLTGPGALKFAMRLFMKTHNRVLPSNDPFGRFAVFEKVQSGHFTGSWNKTVTVASSQSAVFRSVVRSKISEYNKMGMPHFSTVRKKVTNVSCIDHLYMHTWKKIQKEQLSSTAAGK